VAASTLIFRQGAGLRPFLSYAANLLRGVNLDPAPNPE